MTEPNRDEITAASPVDQDTSREAPGITERPEAVNDGPPPPEDPKGPEPAPTPESAEAQGTAKEAPGDDGGKTVESAPSPAKTWYPYITKAQFEKFISRLESKMPAQIDREYVRAIIRTPSMIYRFLRGIEAMRLIDRDQRPTERLQRLVDKAYRPYALAEVLRDLYGDLVTEWQESGEALGDDAMVEFFRSRTGMGRDSAN